MLKKIILHPYFRIAMVATIVALLLTSCEYGVKHGNNSTTNNNSSNTNTNDKPSVLAENEETNTGSESKENEEENQGEQRSDVTIPDAPNSNDFREADLRYEGEKIVVTHHARCRMGCRFIDAYEIQEVIDQDNINRRKSNNNPAPGKCPTIAYEGLTKDKQTVRVILGDCDDKPIIITVIDLKNEYKCSCK